MTSKNFSSSKKFSEFLRQICTVAFLNPFLLLSPDSSFLVPLQCCWKRIKPSKSLQLSFYPNPMRGKRLCLETQCGEWGNARWPHMEATLQGIIYISTPIPFPFLIFWQKAERGLRMRRIPSSQAKLISCNFTVELPGKFHSIITPNTCINVTITSYKHLVSHFPPCMGKTKNQGLAQLPCLVRIGNNQIL